MFTIVTCAEDELAARVSQHLFKRALAEGSAFDHVRDNVATFQFVGLEGNPGWTLNRDLGVILERHGRRIGIHLPRDLKGNALRAYRAVRFAQTLQHEALTILVIAYDREGRSEDQMLIAGVRAAAARNVVVAEAEPEFDAWVLCGFVPGNAVEQTRLAEWVARLAPRGVHRSPRRKRSPAMSTATNVMRRRWCRRSWVWLLRPQATSRGFSIVSTGRSPTCEATAHEQACRSFWSRRAMSSTRPRDRGRSRAAEALLPCSCGARVLHP